MLLLSLDFEFYCKPNLRKIKSVCHQSEIVTLPYGWTAVMLQLTETDVSGKVLFSNNFE